MNLKIKKYNLKTLRSKDVNSKTNITFIKFNTLIFLYENK